MTKVLYNSRVRTSEVTNPSFDKPVAPGLNGAPIRYKAVNKINYIYCIYHAKNEHWWELVLIFYIVHR